ncbi:hypothetical protein [Embleya sp. NPDC059259]
MCVAAGGIALAPTVTVATIGGVVVLGVGSGMFACHIGLLVLTGVPGTHLSRMQALLTLVQSAALLVANNALGALADEAGPTTATTLSAVMVGVAGIVASLNRPMRRARNRRDREQSRPPDGRRAAHRTRGHTSTAAP